MLCVASLSSCASTIPAVTATERELCIQWRDSLPSRSRRDTAQTQTEIGTAYDIQAAACPKFQRFEQP